MADKNLPDEGQLNENFDEDFDFGEGELEVGDSSSTESSSSGRPKRQLISLGILIVVVGFVFAGYKFYHAKRTVATTNVSATTVVKATAVPPPIASPSPPATGEGSFGGIAEAFSSADQGAHPGAGQASPKTAQGVGGSIQELQKDLFSPEKVSPSGENVQTPLRSEVTQLTENLNKLNQQIDFVLNRIKYLDGYTQEVSENLAKFNEAITAMDRRLSSLTSTTTSLSKDVGSVRNEVGQVRRVLREDGLDVNLGAITGKKQRGEVGAANVSIEEPEYVVHAVIPGRAWLKSRKGHIVTVTEGDTIGNYGKILVIDAASGVVLTSSGVTFN